MWYRGGILSTKDRREALLRTAEALFLERGLEFSVEDVAREARTSKRAVYQHFDSKEALVRAVLERFARKIDEGYEKAANAALPLGPWLRGLLSAAAGRYDPILVLRVREVRRAYPGLWDEFSNWSAEGWDEAAEAISVMAAAEGRRRPDPEVLEILLAGYHRELGARGFRLKDGRGPEAALSGLADLLELAIGSSDGPVYPGS